MRDSIRLNPERAIRSTPARAGKSGDQIKALTVDPQNSGNAMLFFVIPHGPAPLGEQSHEPLHEDHRLLVRVRRPAGVPQPLGSAHGGVAPDVRQIAEILPRPSSLRSWAMVHRAALGHDRDLPQCFRVDVPGGVGDALVPVDGHLVQPSPGGEIVVPRGEAMIQAGDRVIFFTLESIVPELESAFLVEPKKEYA